MVSLFNILFFNKLYNFIVQYSEFLVELVFINTISNKCKGITAILLYFNKAWIDEKNDLLLSELCDRLVKILLLIIPMQVQRL